MTLTEIILLLITIGFCYGVAKYWHSLSDKPEATPPTATPPVAEPPLMAAATPPPSMNDEKLDRILQQVISSGRLNKEQSEVIGSLNTEIKSLKGQLENKIQETTSGIDDKKREQHLNTIFDAHKKASWDIGEQVPATAETMWRRSPEAELAESYAKLIMVHSKPQDQSDILFRNKMAGKNVGKDDDLILICFPSDPVIDDTAFISVNYNTSTYNNLTTFRLDLYDLLKDYVESKACTIIIKDTCKLEPKNERNISLMWIEPGIIQKVDADTWKIVKPIQITCY
jgi:polyhydroxyalkanoate synthesis regulator phasin